MLFLFYFFISSVCFITFAGKMSIDEYEFPRLSLHDFYGDFNINLISVRTTDYSSVNPYLRASSSMNVLMEMLFYL